MEFYTVLHDDTSTITDISLLVKDYITNPVPLALADIDYLYVGYYKKFSQLYVELKPFNIISGDMNFQYFDGTIWQSLTVIDESQNFFKSGFIYFEKPTDWVENTIDSKENFYIRMQPTVSHDATTTMRGLGILLSNDIDLEGIKSNIVTKLNNGESWVGKHEAARKHIIQKLRNLGHRKFTSTDVNNPLLTEKDGRAIYFSDLTEFDLHEPFQLREASKFYALSFIYLDELSDEEDDKYSRAGIRHERRADDAVNLFMLKLDTNDNGEEDESETQGSTRTNLTWV